MLVEEEEIVITAPQSLLDSFGDLSKSFADSPTMEKLVFLLEKSMIVTEDFSKFVL